MDFLTDVRHGVWRELESPRVKIDAYRRNLQRSYLDLVNNKINGGGTTLPAGFPPGFAAFFASSGDERPLYRAQLRQLNTEIAAALARASDRETRAHLESARDQIAKILDPKFAAGSGSGGNVIRIGFDQPDPFSGAGAQNGTCWPDYVIRP